MGCGEGGCLLKSPAFLKKTFEMVDDPRTDSIISWSDSKKSFILWDPHKFCTDLLPQIFKHSNLSSFVRQLNTYRFKKINSGLWEYANESFQKGKKHLLRDIKRRPTNVQKQAGSKQPQQQQSCDHQTSSTIESEFKILKKDELALKQEILNMKQQQEKAEKQLEIIQESMQRMEFEQQQLLIFMSKAYKSPGSLKLLQHLVQKQKTCSDQMHKTQKIAQVLLSVVDAEELKRVEQAWNMTEADVGAVFSSDESVSPLEDQKNGVIKSPDYSSQSFILLEKLMENEPMINDGEQSRNDLTKTYYQEWEQVLFPKV